MKKTAIAIIALLLVVVLFVVSFNYRNKRIEQSITNDSSVTYNTTVQNTTKTVTLNEKKNKLLAKDDRNGFELYYDGEIVTVKQGDYQRQYMNWKFSVDLEVPQIYSKDCDGDGQAELMVKLVSGTLDYGDNEGEIKRTYVIYILKPYQDADGNKTFKAYTVTDDTWKTPFESAIRCEMTQLKSCNKYLQLSMDDLKEKIEYDEKTGITYDGHTYYAKALSNNKKEYYTLSRWSKGVGNYNITNDGTITLDIQVLVNYEEVKDTQYVGNIHCEVGIVKGRVTMVPNTIVFIPLDEFKTNDPREIAEKNWEGVITNKSTNTNFESKDIDWIDTEFNLSNLGDESSIYFDTMSTKIKCVDNIKFTQSGIVLTAKEGYTFSKHIADRGDFSVIINKGKDNEEDIAYSCNISNKDGLSVMTIRYDKTYDKKTLGNILIKFGA